MDWVDIRILKEALMNYSSALTLSCDLERSLSPCFVVSIRIHCHSRSGNQHIDALSLVDPVR